MPTRVELIQQIIPLLWDIKPNLPKSKWRSSYGAKHHVEHALRFYIGNTEFIAAAVGMGIPHQVGDPNYRFALKPRFPERWIQPYHRQDHRPPHERKSQWETFLRTCEEIDRIVHELIKDDTSTDNRFAKLAKAVGHHVAPQPSLTSATPTAAGAS